jgi:hypothetical protein
MSKPMQPLVANFNNLGEWNLEPSSVDWNPIGFGVTGWYIETYFDTSGYTLDDLTTVPLSAYIQEAGRYQVSYPGNVRLLTLDIMMEKRIEDVAGMVQEIVGSNSGFPGSMNSRDDWSQVQFLRFREFTGITQAATVQDVFASVNDQQFGSMEPTTADKIWLYKIVIVAGTPTDEFAQLRFPSSRAVMDIRVVDEPDLTYLFRQKRSYELTNY